MRRGFQDLNRFDRFRKLFIGFEPKEKPADMRIARSIRFNALFGKLTA